MYDVDPGHSQRQIFVKQRVYFSLLFLHGKEHTMYYCPKSARILLINTFCDSTKLYSFSSLPRNADSYLMSTVSASLNALFKQELKEEYLVI